MHNECDQKRSARLLSSSTFLVECCRATQPGAGQRCWTASPPPRLPRCVCRKCRHVEHCDCLFELQAVWLLIDAMNTVTTIQKSSQIVRLGAEMVVLRDLCPSGTRNTTKNAETSTTDAAAARWACCTTALEAHCQYLILYNWCSLLIFWSKNLILHGQVGALHHRALEAHCCLASACRVAARCLPAGEAADGSDAAAQVMAAGLCAAAAAHALVLAAALQRLVHAGALARCGKHEHRCAAKSFHEQTWFSCSW